MHVHLFTRRFSVTLLMRWMNSSQKYGTILLADFEDDNVESRLLIDGVWWGEANREKTRLENMSSNI